VLSRLDSLARDVGRLRRMSDGENWTLERIADHVDALDAMLSPTAGERYRDNLACCGYEQVSVEAALRDTKDRAWQLRDMLGGRA
jgi:hypothetical protein